MNRRGLVTVLQCGQQKREGTHRACDLYTSTLFMLQRRAAERRGDPWVILSGKHGVLQPQDVIESYDVRADRRSDRESWASDCRRKLVHLFGPGATFYVLAGEKYLPALRGLRIVLPLAGLGIGKRLAALKAMAP